MTTRRALPVLLPALFLAACAGGGAAEGDLSAEPRTFGGDELLAAGDFDGAVRAYEREGAAQGSAAEREKLLNAKTRAAVTHASAAVLAAEVGEFARARDELNQADVYGPGLPVVRDAHAIIDGRLAAVARSAALREQAKSLVAKDPAEAERLLADARAASPDAPPDPATVRLVREATLRAEADRGAERAAAAWAARDRERTARELAGAQYGGRPVWKTDALRTEIEEELLAAAAGADEETLRDDLRFAQDAELGPSVVRALRGRLVDRLLSSAAGLRETRRPATAALLELEAARLRPGATTPSLDRVREAATLTVLVAAFEDGTGGRVDGAEVARVLRERLVLDSFGGGLPLRAIDDSAEARAAHPDALRLTGRVLTSRQSGGRIGRETTRVPYRSGTTRRPNPEFEEVAALVTAAVSAVRAAEAEQKDAAEALGSLRASALARADAEPLGGGTAKFAAAQERADRATQALAAARKEELALRQRAATLSREIEEPVMSERDVVVTTSAKTVQLTARVELTSVATTLLSQDVTAAAQHKETVADGWAPGGIAPDPDEMPDDRAMAAQAADRFAAMAAGRVRAAAEGAAHRHLAAARDARAGGRLDDAAECYATYLLATPDAASPDRAEAARALAELLGVHVALQTTPRAEGP